MAEQSFDIAVVGGGLGAFHAVEEVLKRSKTATVAFVHGFAFQEFPMGAAIFLNDPSQHVKFTSGDPDKWQMKHPRVTYFMSSVETADCDAKRLTLMNKGPDAGKVLAYKALIVATGSKTPLFTPTPGASLSERIAEVRAVATALKQASTVVFNGAGLVGLEMCGDFRAKHGYGAKVILLTRSGKILDTDFGDKAKTPKPDLVAHCTEVLKEKFKVEIKQASPTGPDATKWSLSAGTLQLEGGEQLAYDVYIPCFSLGPNTGFLRSSKDSLLEKGGALASSDCLQSTAHPEVFGVGVTSFKLQGHPISARVTAAAITAAGNAVRLLEGKPVEKHVDKQSPPPMEHPMNVKIGHGKGGYMLWTNLPGPAKVCCCLPCGGGYPCCPPPCCWCCLPGCSGMCGSCGGPAEGAGPAFFMPGLLTKFMPNHGYKGAGDYGKSVEAPQQQAMYS